MSNNMTFFDKVSRQGDTMVGDLNLGANRVSFNEGTGGGSLRAMPGQADYIELRNRADTQRGNLQVYNMALSQNVLMMSGKTIDGVDVSVLKTDHDTHIADVANPHTVTRAQVGAATMLTVEWVGDGTDDRNINVGVDLASMSEVYIIIKSASSVKGVHRYEYGQGDLSMAYDVGVDQVDWIQGLTSTGFQIGAANWVNQNTISFRCVIIYKD